MLPPSTRKAKYSLFYYFISVPYFLHSRLEAKVWFENRSSDGNRVNGIPSAVSETVQFFECFAAPLWNVATYTNFLGAMYFIPQVHRLIIGDYFFVTH